MQSSLSGVTAAQQGAGHNDPGPSDHVIWGDVEGEGSEASGNSSPRAIPSDIRREESSDVEAKESSDVEAEEIIQDDEELADALGKAVSDFLGASYDRHVGAHGSDDEAAPAAAAAASSVAQLFSPCSSDAEPSEAASSSAKPAKERNPPGSEPRNFLGHEHPSGVASNPASGYAMLRNQAINHLTGMTNSNAAGPFYHGFPPDGISTMLMESSLQMEMVDSTQDEEPADLSVPSLAGTDDVPQKVPKRKQRPCKGQRSRYRKQASLLEEWVALAPETFDPAALTLPPSIENNAHVKQKLLARLQSLKDGILASRSAACSASASQHSGVSDSQPSSPLVDWPSGGPGGPPGILRAPDGESALGSAAVATLAAAHGRR